MPRKKKMDAPALQPHMVKDIVFKAMVQEMTAKNLSLSFELITEIVNAVDKAVREQFPEAAQP